MKPFLMHVQPKVEEGKAIEALRSRTKKIGLGSREVHSSRIVDSFSSEIRTSLTVIVATEGSGIVEDHHHTVELFLDWTLKGWQIGLNQACIMPHGQGTQACLVAV
ncbi:E3 ubiquitin-protein ligase UPL3 -like protein [Gossypium arboreum]|uniref:E3 ubiquitin-protein ligase UPL3-like protein n=1 Tax=Gossypium arboreum TaxID=29729 RepID=A0A0B0PAH8_GOSAR|nr:E3 ubiquitin-protein ligase UPL3 -like protein [Gossypium arboreum]